MAVIGIIRGFNVGFAGQIGALLGIAFGIGVARLCGNDVGMWLLSEFHPINACDAPEYTAMFLGNSICYLTTFTVLAIICNPLAQILAALCVGLPNALVGSIIGLFKYAMIVSLIYNTIVGIDNESVLLQYGTQGDGNIAEATMLLAPAVLGCQGHTDLSYQLQLKEASKISLNLNKKETVRMLTVWSDSSCKA